MQPLWTDLRQRILDAVDNREGSRRKLAARFKVNTSTITRLLQLRRETGSYEPRPPGRAGAATLQGHAPWRLRSLVPDTPGRPLRAPLQGRGASGTPRIR